MISLCQIFYYLCLYVSLNFSGIGGDFRTAKRLQKLTSDMINSQSCVINRCCESHKDLIAAYRLMRNDSW
ncbi:MAG: hypothetical protein IKH88_16660, partial [Prevotella sp.]|nr:hypothetical protein [Prevotella sp.]